MTGSMSDTYSFGAVGYGLDVVAVGVEHEGGTRASTSPVAGFVTSSCSEDAAGVHDPPM